MSGGRGPPGSHRTSRPDRRCSDASTRSKAETFATRSGRVSASVERASSTNMTSMSDASVDAIPASSQPLPHRPSSGNASVRSPEPVPDSPQLRPRPGPDAQAVPHHGHRVRTSPETPYSGSPGSGEDLDASMVVSPGTPPPSRAPPPPKLPTKAKRGTVDADTDKRKAATMHDKKRKTRPGPEPDTILPWHQDSWDNFEARDDILGWSHARPLEYLGLLGCPGQPMDSAYPPAINDADIDGQDDEGNHGGQLVRQEEDGDWDMCEDDELDEQGQSSYGLFGK